MYSFFDQVLNSLNLEPKILFCIPTVPCILRNYVIFSQAIRENKFPRTYQECINLYDISALVFTRPNYIDDLNLYLL